MRHNKKGVFYLLLSTLFIMIMIVVFLAYKEYNYTDKQKVVETRVLTINDFIKSIDTDSGRVIYISGFRALIALEDYVTHSRYLNDTELEERFRDAFYEGTVNGIPVYILTDSSYTDYLNRLRITANQLGLGIDINVTNVSLSQTTPWSVTVAVTTHININDTKGLAKWDFNKTYATNVSLINIRDPIYSLSTYGLVFNTIRISSITHFVNGSNDTTNLSLQINNSYYVSNALAPSFLMRMTGNFSSSACCGIESLVNIQKLWDQSVNYSNSKSIVDYILFTNVTDYTNLTCNFQNMPSWFKMDSNHTAKYEISNLSNSPC